jgi:two-component system sensor histidine kinase QseC
MSLVERARESLRGRLALSLVAGLVAVLGIQFFALHLLIRQEFYSNLDEELLSRLRAVATYVADHPGRESVAEFMPQFRTREHEDFFQVWDDEGASLARSDSSAGKDLPRLQSAIGRPTYHDLTLPDGHKGRAIAESFVLRAGDPRGVLHVVMAQEIAAIESIESRIHFILFGSVVVTILSALAIARYTVLSGLRPVDELAQSLEKVDVDDSRAHLDTGPLPRELRPVASRFAELLNRLLEGLAREKRYARNVAHELRNPLAEMRLFADIGEQATDPDLLRAYMREIRASAAEMEQIVDSLMALTRYEAGLEAPQLEPVELCGQLRQQAAAMKAAADQRELTIELDLPAELWIHTDSALARRLVGNLLGNAIAHAPEGSVVQVRLDQGARLLISNPAPQLTAMDIPRLSERFFRIDTRDGGSHAGLGLAIAGAIASVLGIRFRLELDEHGDLVAGLDGFGTLDGIAERPQGAP